nr:hypothetical protein [Chloroflexota bacterium]
LEFNARFGDPEAQVLLPLLDVPLGALLLAAATDRLADARRSLGIAGHLLPTRSEASVGVVLAAPGYPATPEVGAPIDGIEAARESGALVFHAGTGLGPDDHLVTTGGRVLTVVATAPTLTQAAQRAYDAAEMIHFPGRQLRRDIGRALGAIDEPEPSPAPVPAGADALA